MAKYKDDIRAAGKAQRLLFRILERYGEATLDEIRAAYHREAPDHGEGHWELTWQQVKTYLEQGMKSNILHYQRRKASRTSYIDAEGKKKRIKYGVGYYIWGPHPTTVEKDK